MGNSAAMTQAEYARHRGISDAMVSKFKAAGRLVLDGDGLVLADESDAALAASIDPLYGGDRTGGASAPSGNDRVSYLDAKTAEARARAAKVTMEAELMAGTLVRADEVEAEAFAQARGAREALIAIPDRLAPLLAAETDAAKVHALLTEELRRVCDQIAGAEIA